MKSLRTIYKIRLGPSSSHSMGPQRAAEHFLQSLDSHPHRVDVELYGSLSKTGKGHMTDRVLHRILSDTDCRLIWKSDSLPRHPCGMIFFAYDTQGQPLARTIYYSVGGGELINEQGEPLFKSWPDYEHDAIEDVTAWCRENRKTYWEYVVSHDQDIETFLSDTWDAMILAVRSGIRQDGVLPGRLQLVRRSMNMLGQATGRFGLLRDMAYIFAYALAVSEENAAGHQVVTAPTCGACGVVPAVLYFFQEHGSIDRSTILRALITAGLFGSSVQARASISGAEVGCQGEVGTACSMAAAAACQIMDGSLEQIEYAAEMALEHMLGLTCDPVAGLVQVPCIERNAFAAMRALECASYAIATNGRHHVKFDTVVNVMDRTGRDLQAKYRETSLGGLAQEALDGLTTLHHIRVN